MALIQSSYYLLVVVAFIVTRWAYRALSDPLQRIPGPYWARMSHLWKAYHMYKRDLPQAVLSAHENMVL